MFQIPDSGTQVGDSDTLHHHATELNCLIQLDSSNYEHFNLPVFSADNDQTVTTEQPRPNYDANDTPSNDENSRGQRRAIPVSIIDWENRDETQFIAATGLDFLNGMSQLFIQQTVELHELRNTRDSAKRYLIKRPEGDTIYYATEQSSSFQRMCFGSYRQFDMTLQDRTQQDAIIFRRRLACGTCSFWCYLQVLEVWSPEEQIGYIKQEMSFGLPCLTVRDLYNNVIYRIEGPPVCPCKYTKEAYFRIYSADGMTQCGSINHSWNIVQVEYTLLVHFPSPNTDKKKKALILGAAFLLEYMFFESSRSCSCICFC